MIIEFYGLPASGKTTDMKAVLEKYENAVDLTEYSKKISKVKKLPYIFAPEFISFFFKAAALFIKKKNKASCDFKIFAVFCIIYIRYMYCRKDRTYDYYLIDHGIVQNTVSAMFCDDFLASQGLKLIAHLGKHFKDETSFIYTVNSDSENTYSRIKNRKTEIRLKNYSFEEAAKVLEIQTGVFEKLTAEAEKSFRLVRIDSLDSFENCFKKICGFIEEMN